MKFFAALIFLNGFLSTFVNCVSECKVIQIEYSYNELVSDNAPNYKELEFESGDQCEFRKKIGLCLELFKCPNVLKQMSSSNFDFGVCGFKQNVQYVCCSFTTSMVTTTTPSPIEIDVNKNNTSSK